MIRWYISFSQCLSLLSNSKSLAIFPCRNNKFPPLTSMAFSSSYYSPLPNSTNTNKKEKNWSNHRNQDKYISTPQGGRRAKPKIQFSSSGFAPVCRCFSSRWSTLFFFSFIFLSFSSSYFLTFCAAYNPIPTTHSDTNIITTISISPSPSTIKAEEGIYQQGKGRKHITNTNNNNNNHSSGHQKRRRVLIITTLSVFVPVVCLLLTMACLTFLNFKRRSKRVEDVEDHQPGTPSSICSTSSSGSSSSQSKKMMNHKIKNNKMFFNNPAAGSLSSSSSVPRRFTWEEIEGLTMNFSSRIIGEGGFSTIYLSHFSDSILGALKIHGGNSERLNRMFKQELEVLLHIQHHNIVNLLGYCDEREEGALVFEYIPNGTLYDKLHHGNDDECEKEVLPWKSRMSIAFQLAQAIEYLHEECKPQIVHGDIKSSNLLLDDQLNPKLCDFGFSKMGFSSTVIKSSMNPIMGSPGYMDPLYLRTGIASKKNDVYSFGVIILELITGIEAFCSEKEQLLTSIVGKIIRDANKVAGMMDPRLSVVAGGDLVQEEAKIMATISAQCLKQQSSLRPSMSEILHTMKDKISL